MFIILHESRPLWPWLIFDVRPYSSTMDTRSLVSGQVRGLRLNSRRIGISDSPALKLPAEVSGMWSRFFSPACAARVAIERSFRVQRFGRASSVSLSTRFDAIFHRRIGPPNKAPEPTTFAVTSRATSPLSEMKQQSPNLDAARAAPAKVVAHL